MSGRANRIKRNREQRMPKEKIVDKTIILKKGFVPPVININKTRLDFKIYAKEKYAKDISNSRLTDIKIVACTSLSPHHYNKDIQHKAVESWHNSKMEVYSFNNLDEIQVLQKIYPDWVRFIPSIKNTKHIFGKPCVIINEMIDHFSENKTGDICMLINSDIVLNATEELLQKIKSISEISIPISHRNDYKEEFNNNKKYSFGFDVFFINKKYVNIFPQAMYSMGQTWWDYWLPYTVLKNKIPVFIIEDLFAFHKEHPMQYNAGDWIKMTEYFKWENNITKTIHQEINDTIRNEIINNSISFKLCQTSLQHHR